MASATLRVRRVVQAEARDPGVVRRVPRGHGQRNIRRTGMVHAQFLLFQGAARPVPGEQRPAPILGLQEFDDLCGQVRVTVTDPDAAAIGQRDHTVGAVHGAGRCTEPRLAQARRKVQPLPFQRQLPVIGHGDNLQGACAYFLGVVLQNAPEFCVHMGQRFFGGIRPYALPVKALVRFAQPQQHDIRCDLWLDIVQIGGDGPGDPRLRRKRVVR